MDKNGSRHTDRRPGEDLANGPMSKLAVAGLIVAVLPCCPLFGLVGALLGLMAMQRIRLYAGRIGGRRVAMAAILVGAVSSLVWTMVMERIAVTMSETQETALIERVSKLFEASAMGRVEEALSLWPTGDANRPSEEEIVRFGEAVAERYGPFDRFAVISRGQSGSIFSPVLEVAGVLHFERGSPLGSARLRVATGMNVWSPDYRLTYLSIEDKELGDLTIGVSGERQTVTEPQAEAP